MTRCFGRRIGQARVSGSYQGIIRILYGAVTCLMLAVAPWSVEAQTIPEDRRVSWVPGVSGGIPYYPNAINVRTAPYEAVGDGIADDTAAIQSAINACPAGRAVLLPQGTYRVTGTLRISSGIVLRGEGPNKTQIVQDSPGGDLIWMGRWSSLGSPVSLSADAQKGSTQLVVASTAGLAAGNYIVLSQLNVPGLVTATGYSSTCSWCGNDDPTRTMTQLVRIASVSGNTLSTSRPLYFDFTTGLSAQARRIGLLEGAGIEDLYLEQRYKSGGVRSVYMVYLSRSWVKNVESYNAAGSAHVWIASSCGCEIRDSYFHEAHDYSSGKGYGVFLFGWNSDHLIENNIVRKVRHSLIFEGGGSGVVFGYNYCIDVYTQPDTTFLSEDASTHGAHPFMNLFEGNVFAKVSFDNTWGSSSHNTVFRNHITATSPGTLYGVVAVDVEQNNYYMNIVGNVLGMPGASFQPWRLGYRTPGTGSSSDDPQVVATLLRHGNLDNSTGQIDWDPAIPEHDLADSYYLSGRPSFLSGFAWPTIGSDVGVGVIPAQMRYENLLNGYGPAAPAPPRGLRMKQ